MYKESEKIQLNENKKKSLIEIKNKIQELTGADNLIEDKNSYFTKVTTSKKLLDKNKNLYKENKKKKNELRVNNVHYITGLKVFQNMKPQKQR